MHAECITDTFWIHPVCIHLIFGSSILKPKKLAFSAYSKESLEKQWHRDKQKVVWDYVKNLIILPHSIETSIKD